MPSQREGGGGGGSTGDGGGGVAHSTHGSDRRKLRCATVCLLPKKKRKKEKKLPVLHFALLFNFAAQRLANFFLGKATVCMASSQVVSVQQLIKSQRERESEG